MLSFLKEISLQAGKICLDAWQKNDRETLSFKNEKDIVTDTDRKIENYLIKAILDRYPHHDIFGEETGSINQNGPCCWIIDPIDGTTSFAHKQPFFSISIAIKVGPEIQYGAVFAPALNQLFYAQKGKGSFLNDIPIRVSPARHLIESVLSTGFACLRAGKIPNNLKFFNDIAPCIRDIRRYGSAAIDLCYVACGKVDGFWEMELNLYDIAAGTLIVTEAGGTVCDFSGGSDFPANGIVAANSRIIEKLLPFFKS